MIGGTIFLLESSVYSPGEYTVVVRGVDTERNDFCYTYVRFYQKEDGYRIFYKPEIGDSIWWQNGFAYWTSQRTKNEVKLKRHGLAHSFKKDD